MVATWVGEFFYMFANLYMIYYQDRDVHYTEADFNQIKKEKYLTSLKKIKYELYHNKATSVILMYDLKLAKYCIYATRTGNELDELVSNVFGLGKGVYSAVTSC